MASRRNQITMSEEELKDFILSEGTLIIVSNGPGGYPHPMPMFFYLDDEGHFLVSTYGASQKVKNYERDPKAALLIEAGHEYEELKAVFMEYAAGKRVIIRFTPTKIVSWDHTKLGGTY